MRAIINCGGKGTRLPEVSKVIPKPMVLINEKPLLQVLLENLKKNGITEVCITVHYLADVIIKHFGDGKKIGMKISYSLEEKLIGTGGALVPIQKFITEDTLLLYGDVITNVNFKKMHKYHLKNNSMVTAAIHLSKHPEDSDLVLFDKNFKLTQILRKPHTNIPKDPHNLAALYLISPSIKKYLVLPTPFDFAHDLLPFVLRSKKNIFCYNTKEFIMDIGTPERLRKAKELFEK